MTVSTLGCAGAAPAVRGPDVEAAIGAVMDDWHAAAAASDEARYFAHFTSDAIFLGTDATERWDVPAFRAYAQRPFSEGHGWRMRSLRRAIMIDPSGTVAWLDEDLESRLGPLRGSAVLRLEGGRWRIAHYNLAATIPNERFDAVRCVLTDGAAEGCAPPEREKNPVPR